MADLIERVRFGGPRTRLRGLRGARRCSPFCKCNGGRLHPSSSLPCLRRRCFSRKFTTVTISLQAYGVADASLSFSFFLSFFVRSTRRRKGRRKRSGAGKEQGVAEGSRGRWAREGTRAREERKTEEGTRCTLLTRLYLPLVGPLLGYLLSRRHEDDVPPKRLALVAAPCMRPRTQLT